MATNTYINLPIEGGDGVTSLNGLVGALTLVAGTGVTITPGVNTITISAPENGTVTSVGLSAPASILSVSGSPVTSSGTLALSLATQSANLIWAGPTSGGAAAPTFRSMVNADLTSDALASIALTQAATDLNTALTIVRRDSSGNFKASLPVVSSDVATKAYVDSLVSGLIWQQPLEDSDLIDDSLSTPPVSPVNSAVYIIGPSPTGDWASIGAGHATWYNVNNADFPLNSWIDLLDRAVIVGDRFGVTFEHGSGSEGGGLVGQHNNIATITDATPGAITYSFFTPANRDAVFVATPNSDHFGHAYVYVAATTQWINFAGPVAISAGDALYYTGNTLNVGFDDTTIGLTGSNELEVKNAGINLTTKVTGVLPIANGGTNSSTSLNNNRVMQSAAGAIVESAAITAAMALISDANGIPTHSVTTATELSYVNGVTSAIQTQLNGKQASGNYITALTGDVTASGPGSAAATLATVNSNVGSFTNASITVNAKGLITAASSGSAGGVTALSAIGASPNANAATITGSTLNLEPASGSFGGVVTTGTQTMAGAKTFSTSLSSPNITATTQFLAANGSVGTPSISFTNDPDTGFYSVGANTIGIAASGNLTFSINGSGTFFSATATGGVNLTTGNGAAVPPYGFTNDTDTGMYRSAANTVGLTGNGLQIAQFNPATSSVNWPSTTAAATTVNVVYGAAGSDTNIGIDITPKGAAGIQFPSTVTGGGTTGNQTINKISGRVNFAASATSLTVTNSIVTTSSLVFAEVQSNDTTAYVKNCVPAAGSFVINLGAAATAETPVSFFVINK